MKNESTLRETPQKWLWRLAADRCGRRLASRHLPQVDDFPPQPYSWSVGVSSAELAERPPTFFIFPKHRPTSLYFPAHCSLGTSSTFAEALAIDALHPEANFNLAWLAFLGSGAISESAINNLDLVTRYDLGEYRTHLYRACLLNLQGKADLANQALNQAIQLCGVHEANDMERLWNLSQEKKLNLILSPPISGEDLALDAERFRRLMMKGEAALEERRYDDANRYLLMSGDIPGFARHPRRRILLSRSLESQ